ncbi:hypothetical protein BT63DRAFT_423175 [Microthyrium microscopicum]|uniref:Uncharacterized protein n=1 Tax=Microthyrium microscopicum TaxID=703497 RepID=A0A6A6UH70_9PEZI|nr:hypothetical protein BT63DRAFT_423175 [Microthyrium microscopicum]
MTIKLLRTRDTVTGQCCNAFGRCNTCTYDSAWYNWGRWVALVVIILAFLFLFCLCSCLSARRRRRVGRQPFYGTGWANQGPWAGNHHGGQHQPQTENPPNTYYAYQQPAPPYEPPSYRGDQQSGIELNRPDHTYNGYEAPAGPPPKKH